MKRLIILLFIICGFSPLIWAVDGCNQERLSPEEFRAKQKAFIIEKAGLTKEEAAKFFPVGPRTTTQPPVIYSQP